MSQLLNTALAKEIQRVVSTTKYVIQYTHIIHQVYHHVINVINISCSTGPLNLIAENKCRTI